MTSDVGQKPRGGKPPEKTPEGIRKRIQAWRLDGHAIMGHSLATAIIERLELLEYERTRGRELLRQLGQDLDTTRDALARARELHALAARELEELEAELEIVTTAQEIG
jgi:hypothetical protein